MTPGSPTPDMLPIALPPRRPVDTVMAVRRADSFGKRSIKAGSKDYALRLAVTMTDLTTLEGKDSPEKVRSLCRKAISPAPARFWIRTRLMPPRFCVLPWRAMPMAPSCCRV